MEGEARMGIIIVLSIMSQYLKPCSERPTQLNSTSSENVKTLRLAKELSDF